MKKIVLVMVCMVGFVFADSDVRVYKEGEEPSVEELKSFFETSKELKEEASSSRLGKSKGLTIGDVKSAKKNNHEAASFGKEISLPIKFANNSYEIQNEPNTIQILNNIKQALQSSKVTLVVEGHTNAIGSKGYNYDLSQKRAEAVKQYLVENGIGSNVLITRGKGFEKPLSGTDPKDPDNRRVQFRVAN